MKSKPSLKSLARHVRLLNLLFPLLFFYGCSSSTTPTYLKKDIESSIQNICRDEYQIDVRARLAGRTLWIYVPFEEIITKPEKPSKYTERFLVEQNAARYLEGAMEFQYLIKPVPEKEKIQESAYDKKVSEKINNVWKVLRRVLFSLDKADTQGPQIICMITADIKKGYYVRDMFCLQDLKRVSYSYISWGEFQHRTIQDIEMAFQIIGDKEGAKLDYRDIPFPEFLTSQIRHRIQLKFQKPEVEKGADTDKEVIKVISNTLNIYNFRDFKFVELLNLLEQNRIILNRKAALAGTME